MSNTEKSDIIVRTMFTFNAVIDLVVGVRLVTAPLTAPWWQTPCLIFGALASLWLYLFTVQRRS